jgi:DNA transposition AAA+ family ATPase
MAVRRYAAINRYVYLRALDVWSPSAMLQALSHELGGYEYHGRAKSFAECVRRLGEDPRQIIIDEADYLAADKHLLNTIRDLHDQVEGSIILVGEERLPVHLQAKHRAHFWGRVAQEMSFQPLTAEEVRQIAATLCEVPVVLSQAQAETIRDRSRGEFRWAKRMIREVETRMRSNRRTEVESELVEEAIRAIRRAA